MAAGTSSRFVPLSAEKPKGLLEVRGEVLIERQIRQLREAGVYDITIVVGYKAEMFAYLKEKYGVDIVYNEDFGVYNNTSSLIRVLDRLADTYICSSDNYFAENVFAETPESSYYSSLYACGDTNEYCMSVNENDCIVNVTVGGRDAWYMVGHVFFSRAFSDKFKEILSKEYRNEATRHGYWEDVFIRYIGELPPMCIHRYSEHDIEEFDSLDELRAFDTSYLSDSRSTVLHNIACMMKCDESALSGFKNIGHEGDFLLFSFMKDNDRYEYNDSTKQLKKL